MRCWRSIGMAVLAAALCGAPAMAQRRGFRPMRPRPFRVENHRPLGSGLDRLSRLPPKQQEKVLRKDPAFQRLSPEQQQQILHRLQWFQSLPPQRQQQVLRRLHDLGELTPEQRKGLENLFQDWRKLPVADRQTVRRAYANLRRLPPDQQQARMNDPNFQQRFTPPQLDVLRRALALQLPNDLVGAKPN